LNEEIIENLNKSITSNVIDMVIKKPGYIKKKVDFSAKKRPGHDGFTVKFYWTSKSQQQCSSNY
jgi:hypothetical protein